MSVESDFRALLANYAPLVALVGTRIAENALPEGSGLPCVVFGVAHTPTLGLDNTVLCDQCAISVQCWADTAAQALAVSDQVRAAVALAPINAGAVVVDRTGAYNEDLGLDAQLLTVEWWA